MGLEASKRWSGKDLQDLGSDACSIKGSFGGLEGGLSISGGEASLGKKRMTSCLNRWTWVGQLHGISAPMGNVTVKLRTGSEVTLSEMEAPLRPLEGDKLRIFSGPGLHSEIEIQLHCSTFSRDRNVPKDNQCYHEDVWWWSWKWLSSNTRTNLGSVFKFPWEQEAGGERLEVDPSPARSYCRLVAVHQPEGTWSGPEKNEDFLILVKQDIMKPCVSH